MEHGGTAGWLMHKSHVDHTGSQARPGYCRRYLLGEAEENCAWPQNVAKLRKWS